MWYKHFSEEERDLLSLYLHHWMKQKYIAIVLWRNPSSISREIKRNKVLINKKYNHNIFEKTKKQNYHYLPIVANKKYKKRKSIAWKKWVILKWWEIREKVTSYIRLWYSPPIISWVMKKNNEWIISHESIYNFIYSKDYKHLKLWEYLPMKRKKRKKKWIRRSNKSKIPNRISISKRSDSINKRIDFGHREADTIEWHKKKSALNVLVERKTRLTKIRKINRKTANNTAYAMIDVFSKMPKFTVKSVTPDNWSEFTQREKVKKAVHIDFYFTHPYSSWEKWTVERINWFIRRFLPKRTNFDNISNTEIQMIEDRINSRPMTILDFHTPIEKFYEEMSNI